jgi:tagaturonate epimerase
VVAYAVRHFGLPKNLKLSIHSGSDKFSLYPRMYEGLRKFDAGVHLKTAGTTWLEELIGLAVAGGDGLEIARDIYTAALGRLDELCAPYASVIDIDRAALPGATTVRAWDGETFAAALRHDPACPAYNPSLRQLLHVGYRIAAEMGPRFTAALERHAEVIASGVTANIYQRHLRPLFLGVPSQK